MSVFRVLTYVLTVIVLLIPAAVSAQDDSEYGRILSITDKTVNVSFANKTVGVGEEVEFWRFTKIVDPVTGDIRGGKKTIVAYGVVDDIGVGKVQVTVTGMVLNGRIAMLDRVLATGKGKQIVRTQKIGTIQELKDDGAIVIDLGTEDEISEGDEFLIQRTETVVDPETKEVTVKNQVDVGRGRVQTADKKTSVASLVQLLPGMEIQKTDNVVFDKLKTEDEIPLSGSPVTIDSLQKEIVELQREVTVLKAAVDSLGQEHLIFKDEIETVLSQLMAGDIKGTRIILKNDEPITRADSPEVFASYKRALDTCLDRKFRQSIELFHAFMKQYPASKLTENCRYWIAQSYFSMGNFETAIEGFRDVIDEKRYTHKDDDAAIMIAITYYKLGKRDEALQAFNNFVKLYPSSEYRKIVENWIKKLSA
ncbi:tetratricopeptide repeat protein [bacterium]|nr:tetratricopeptide repeat protein [bacterium]